MHDFVSPRDGSLTSQGKLPNAHLFKPIVLLMEEPLEGEKCFQLSFLSSPFFWGYLEGRLHMFRLRVVLCKAKFER
jgi:hypothetical protein